MAGEETTNQGNVKIESALARIGMNMDNSVSQVPKGAVTYALNASVENFDANSVNYQNEPSNEFCVNFPTGYMLIGTHFIPEKNKHIFFLANSDTGGSQIGYMDNNDCVYRIYVNNPCLNFNIDYPIHKCVHKITNCTTEIYWTDGFNPRRYLDLENIPYIMDPATTLCNPAYTTEVDCNQLKMQPNFSIPSLAVVDVINGGDLTSGTYQFAIQYSDASGNPYTSYYSITNPTPIANTHITNMDFNYQVGRSIVLNITNLDGTGQWQYFNIAVIKTINNIPSVELVGTYYLDKTEKQIIYTGQNVALIKLTINDIFEKYPYYDIAGDVTTAQDILIWDNLSSIDRLNYQSIASKITLQWQTYRLPNTETYADEINATNLRGYLRDEVYAFEIVFLLRNGKQTDGFHIPGRLPTPSDKILVDNNNNDFIGEPDEIISGIGYSPYWKIYNTGYKVGDAPGKSSSIDYRGEWEYGEFAYWESTELYPCNSEVWGDLADQPIRHHKFPDVLVSPINESPTIFYDGNGNYAPVMQKDAIFPIGVKLNVSQVLSLIQASNLTSEQKSEIVGFKIVRGDRGTNKSVIAKGILRNVGKYKREGTEYYYPNYPYNDLRPDPFILDGSNAYVNSTLTSVNSDIVCRSFTITAKTDTIVEYLNCNTNLYDKITVKAGTAEDICSLDFPKPNILSGTAFINCNTYKRYSIKARGGYFTVLQANIDANTTPTGGASYHTFLGFMPNPHGTPPLGYSTWVDYCLDYPTDSGCTRCLSNFDYWVSHYNYSGQDLGYIYYFDCITPPVWSGTGSDEAEIKEIASFGYDICNPDPLDGFKYPDAAYRYVFNSPETSFGQPFLGDVLRLENVMFGAGKAHFTQVKKNAYYKLLTAEAQKDAIDASYNIGDMTTDFNATAMFTAYQSYLTIYINGITRRNYAYSFNSIASYDYWANIYNQLGIKQREIELTQYLIPGVQSVGDDLNLNNWNRESSVYIKTKSGSATAPAPLPFAKDTPTIQKPSGGSFIEDDSRFILSDITRGGDCNNPEKEIGVKTIAYYGSMKNTFVNQWGQIYSYETIDTGAQFNIDLKNILNPLSLGTVTVFGGDTFISRFAFKTKLPFFIDWRVNAPDDSDIFYDEIGNVGYPQFWHSSRSILGTYPKGGVDLTNFISIKAHNFDCPNKQEPKENNPGRTYYDGKFYLFAYGIPAFYCETSINVDLRQAFNSKEGDFWPHVSSNIPDDWVQESFVPIAQDNTYYYNVTYSKQNKENLFSHLPADWDGSACSTNYPFRAIYSDSADSNPDIKVNAWLSYSATASFDFPQNFGKLTSLDGIQNKAVLARFENKSLLYNTMLTVQTSNPQAAYLGNDTLFKSSPPIDFAETDLGYVGSQNKFILKIPQGQITADAKRGQIFLISGNQSKDITSFGSGMNRFFTDHLAFEILRYFPDVDTDNHFKGLGLHGVYDSKYDRIIITKLDYIPKTDAVKYNSTTKDFYIERNLNGIIIPVTVYLEDSEYFCNKSWTLSFNMNTMSWISFHSYIPNWYIAENNFFYSGLNGGCDLGAIAYEEIPYTTTTTTLCIGCKPPEPTTTTSSTTLYCDLEGEASYLTPTTTTTSSSSTSSTTTSSTTTETTTLCPTCVTYQITNSTESTVIFTYISCYDESTVTFYINANSITNICACESPVLPEGVSSTIISESGCLTCFCYSVTNNTGKTADFSYIDCEGSLISNIMAIDEVFYVCAQQGSVSSFFPLIIEGGVNPCTEDGQCNPSLFCMPIYIDDAESKTTAFYKYDVATDTSTLLSVPSAPVAQSDVAITFTKMWTVLGGVSFGNTSFHEWDITLDPWSATFSRDILFPAGFVPSNGLAAISNTKLLTIDEFADPGMVVEIDVSGPTAIMTNKFPIADGEIVSGDMILTSTGKFLVTTENKSTGDISLFQYDYSTGAFEVQVILTGTLKAPYGLFESNGTIYIGEGEGKIYSVLPYYPYTLTVEGTTPVPISGMSQVPSCITEALVPTCCCYQLEAKTTSLAAWTDCNGIHHEEYFSGAMTICAKQRQVTVNGSYDVHSIAELSCGCTDDASCGKGVPKL